ncbi:hypothetical protein BHE74_00021783, partial [Ensete ventricosum]
MEDGRAIAVKRLTRAATDEQREKDFLTELGTVGHVRHPNVSALLGCCIDRDLHLIFEFSSRGSVSSNLHDENSPPMAWKLRYDIAVGTARGLHYLHKGCQRRIIHRDIKASNILLTTSFEPQVYDEITLLLLHCPIAESMQCLQISDFGLAKWLPSDSESTGELTVSTQVLGAGVLHAWHRGREDGRLRLRRLPAGDHIREKASGWLPQELAQLEQNHYQQYNCLQVVELLEGGEISQDRWTTPEKEAEEVKEEFWSFDDLTNDDDDDDDDDATPSSLGSPNRNF